MAQRTLNWYLDRALARAGDPSERTFAMRIGLAAGSLSNYRQRKAWPSEAVMIRIAEAAGLDPDRALQDLHSWRAPTPELRERYQRIAKVLEKAGAMVAITAIFIGGILATPTAEALERDENRLTSARSEVYIIRQ